MSVNILEHKKRNDNVIKIQTKTLCLAEAESSEDVANTLRLCASDRVAFPQLFVHLYDPIFNRHKHKGDAFRPSSLSSENRNKRGI